MAVILSSLAGSMLLIGSAQANQNVFVYQDRDLVVTFRSTSAAADLEVDIGQASQFYSAAAGSTNHVTGYSASELNAAFPGLANLTWSAGGCVPPAGDSGDPSYPIGTLWMTSPRNVDPTVAAKPWVRNSTASQTATASKVKSLLSGARSYSGTIPTSAANTTSAVLIPTGNLFVADNYLGTGGNYNNTFQGDVENTTAAVPSRCDLYQLVPDNTATQPAGKYLGYLELETNGTMNFVAATGPAPAPSLSVSLNAGVSTISFATFSGANYTLYYTNAAGLSAPTANWSTVTTNITGNGGVQSFQQPVTDANRFFRVLAH